MISPIIPPDAQCYFIGSWYKTGPHGLIFYWDSYQKIWLKSSYKILPCIPVKYHNIRDMSNYPHEQID